MIYKLNSESINFDNHIENNSVQDALDTVMTCIYFAAECMKTIKTDVTIWKNKNQPWFWEQLINNEDFQ